MINVEPSRVAVEAMAAAIVIVPREQYLELLDEVSRGNKARRALRGLNRAVNVAASMEAAA